MGGGGAYKNGPKTVVHSLNAKIPNNSFGTITELDKALENVKTLPPLPLKILQKCFQNLIISSVFYCVFHMDHKHLIKLFHVLKKVIK